MMGRGAWCVGVFAWLVVAEPMVAVTRAQVPPPPQAQVIEVQSAPVQAPSQVHVIEVQPSQVPAPPQAQVPEPPQAQVPAAPTDQARRLPTAAVYRTQALPDLPGEQASERRPRGPIDAVVEGSIGGHFSAQTDGAQFSLAGYLRYYALQVGLRGAYGTSYVSDEYVGASALGGLAWQLESGLRVDTMGVLGLRHHWDVGSDFIVLGRGDPGATATLPYAGVTWSVAYAVGSPRRGLFMLIGVRAAIERELQIVTRQYTYLETHIFGSSMLVTTSHKVGSTWGSVLLTISGRFDL